MKRIALTAFLAMALVLGPGCGKDKDALKKVDQIKEIASAEVSIERLRKQQNPDWEAITTTYEVTLPMVEEADQACGTSYKTEIPEALGKIKAGDQVRVNQQILAKGLQHAAVCLIKKDLAAMDEDPYAALRIAARFEGIRPTFTRRDKDFFGGTPTLEAAADDAMERLKKSGKSDLAARQALIDAIDRTYALSTLYEITGVEKMRETKRDECAVKQKEGEVFYRILSPRIRRTSPRADATLSAMINGPYGTMNSEEAEKLLNEGLSGVTLR